jgi:hypothetical protein
MENREKLAAQCTQKDDKQSKNTTQYVYITKKVQARYVTMSCCLWS